MDLKRGQKQGRDERTQENYLTYAKIHSRWRVVFWRSFICLAFCPFFRPILNRNEVLQKVSSLVFVLFRGFFKPPSKQKTNTFIVLETITFTWRTNVLCASDKRFSAGNEHVQTSASLHTHSYTCSYQWLSNWTSLKTATHRYSHLRKWVVAITLS